MKILCIADLHGDDEAAARARDYAVDHDIDHVLILGDFPGHGVFHNSVLSTRMARDILELFKALNVKAVPGNCDPRGITTLFEEYGANLHEKTWDVDGIKIAGFGGSNVTPFGTPFEYGEEEIYEKIKALLSGVAGECTILALHCPPKDTLCDKTASGLHAGSSSIRRIIEERRPVLAVCSHIHEAAGSVDTVGKTIVANIGKLGDGNAGVIETGKRVCIKLMNWANEP